MLGTPLPVVKFKMSRPMLSTSITMPIVMSIDPALLAVFSPKFSMRSAYQLAYPPKWSLNP